MLLLRLIIAGGQEEKTTEATDAADADQIHASARRHFAISWCESVHWMSIIWVKVSLRFNR